MASIETSVEALKNCFSEINVTSLNIAFEVVVFRILDLVTQI